MSNPQNPELPVNALIGLGARPIEFRSTLTFLEDADRTAFITHLGVITTAALATALSAYSTTTAMNAAIASSIAALVNSAPSLLDTLGEIAAQLASDESAATALTATVAGKLAKASNLSDLANAAAARTNLGLGNVTNDAQLKAADLDTDNTLAANSDTKIPSQKAVKAFVIANAGGGGAPGGSDTQIQFNASGSLAGTTGLTWDESEGILTLVGGGSIVATAFIGGVFAGSFNAGVGTLTVQTATAPSATGVDLTTVGNLIGSSSAVLGAPTAWLLINGFAVPAY